MSQTKIFQTTEELWNTVINGLPEDVKENATVPAGKPYVHIKPKSKRLGVKDFKYCLEYLTISH